MSNKLDLLNMKFGRLLVTSVAIIKDGKSWFEVKCECGVIKKIRGTSLKNGISKSCGICVKRVKKTLLGDSAKWSLYILTQKSASKRNKFFNLSLEEFLRITGSACYYCGCKWSSEYPNMKYTTKRPSLEGQYKLNGSYKHNGIDRLDNEIGYVSDNCVACCKTCNIAKNTMSVEDFKGWIKNVHNHFVVGEGLRKEIAHAGK